MNPEIELSDALWQKVVDRTEAALCHSDFLGRVPSLVTRIREKAKRGCGLGYPAEFWERPTFNGIILPTGIIAKGRFRATVDMTLLYDPDQADFVGFWLGSVMGVKDDLVKNELQSVFIAGCPEHWFVYARERVCGKGWNSPSDTACTMMLNVLLDSYVNFLRRLNNPPARRKNGVK